MEATMSKASGQTRRTVLGDIAAGAGMMSMAGETAAQAPTLSKTFVLVHGAWHGGWCWRRVADRLEGKGHKVFCPTMTGLGERSHLLTKDVNLATHITDIVNVIKWENLKDVVLVGHSYGGIVISGVAEQAQSAIGSIVFLDAFVPDSGTSLGETASQVVRDMIATATAKGEITLKPVPAAVFRVNEADRAWVDAMCTPHPIATFSDKITITGARDKVAKKAYIRGTAYPQPTFDKNLAAKKADPSWRTYEVACGHDVMVDAPDRLAEILIEVA
jgi:pimeloyl-ACP methyl ester carboxylesterase